MKSMYGFMWCLVLLGSCRTATATSENASSLVTVEDRLQNMTDASAETGLAQDARHDTVEASPVSPASTPTLPARGFLPGTLMRDQDGAYWMVRDWPEIQHVPPRLADGFVLNLARAIQVDEAVMHCYHRSYEWSEAPYDLIRESDDALWYLDRRSHVKRRAEPVVMRARGDREDRARSWQGSREEWAQFTHSPPLPLPSGLVIRTPMDTWFFSHEYTLFRVDPHVMQHLGYDTERPFLATQEELESVGGVGARIRDEIFALCPTEQGEYQPYADGDGDRIPFTRDCDDTNPEISPVHAEICDRLDNDCNGQTDEGEHLCEL